MACFPKTKFWCEFIELYIFYEELYNKKILQQRKHEELLDTLKEIEPNADMDDLKKLLYNMRSNYNHELKKTKLYNSYTPTLWYFDSLELLEESDVNDEVNVFFFFIFYFHYSTFVLTICRKCRNLFPKQNFGVNLLTNTLKCQT